MQGNSGETQKSLLKPIKVQGNSGETQGKIKKSFLKPTKVQGNLEETQKYISKANKSAWKLGGNSFLWARKVQSKWGKLKKLSLANCMETQK